MNGMYVYKRERVWGWGGMLVVKLCKHVKLASTTLGEGQGHFIEVGGNE